MVCNLSSSLPIQFSNSHVHSRTRIRSRASIARGVLLVLPLKRGAWSAVRRTLSSFRFRHRVRSDDVSESASPHGAPFAAICEPGTVLPGKDGGATRPLIRQAFAAFVHHLVQPRTAEPRSWPGRSTPAFRTVWVRTTSRRRRILLRLKSALEKRPSRTGHAEHKSGLERGDLCPHHEMLLSAVIPGRAPSREPGIHGHPARCP